MRQHATATPTALDDPLQEGDSFQGRTGARRELPAPIRRFDHPELLTPLAVSSLHRERLPRERVAGCATMIRPSG